MEAIGKLKNIKFIKTMANIFSVEDLRAKILFTIAMVTVYRFGSYVVLPGIDTNALQGLHQQTEGGLMSLLDMFSGGAFSKASIFALGIMPYISASIVMQLLGIAVPYFQKMQREGESGRRKMNQYTRYLTVLILLFQAPSYLLNLKMQTQGTAIYSSLPGGWAGFLVISTIILAAGSMFILWLGERITDKGIGNGVSLIIMIGIIARFPNAFGQELASRWDPQNAGLVVFLLEIVIYVAVIAAAICLVTGVRQVPERMGRRARAEDAEPQAGEGPRRARGPRGGVEPLVVDEPIRPAGTGPLVHGKAHRPELRGHADVRVVPQRELPRPHGGGSRRVYSSLGDDEHERLEQRVPLGRVVHVHPRRGSPVRRSSMALVRGRLLQRALQGRHLGQRQPLQRRLEVRARGRHVGLA